MHDSTLLLRFGCVAVAAAVGGCGAPGDPAVRADDFATSSTISTASAPVLETDGSLAALTAEVRQLRVAVEQLARSQTEAQAWGAALSAQQSRVEQMTQQLDAARKEIEQLAEQSRGFEDQATRFSQELSTASDHQQRAAIEVALRSTEAERDAVERALQNARGSESNLSRALALEENRWNDLLSRAGQAGR